VPTFADRGCHVVSVTDPYGRILDVLDQHFNNNNNYNDDDDNDDDDYYYY
jgi:hypothetical protein